MENKNVFMIFDKKGTRQGAYSRAYHTVYEFDSEESARSSNVHDLYKDEEKYEVREYELIYVRVNPTGSKE